MVLKQIKKIFSYTLLTSLLATPCYAGKVYVYRNADGVLVFSDAPKTGQAEEIKLITKPTIIPKDDAPPKTLPLNEDVAKVEYSINIEQPSDQATIRDNTGSVYISGSVSPYFEKGSYVRLLLDGQQYGEKLTRATQILRNIDRGEHSVQLELLDKTGKIIASSELVTFYLHRASVNNNAGR